KVPEQPTPDRPVEPLMGVFSDDTGMMYEAKTKAPEVPAPKRQVPYRPGMFDNDTGMMYQETEAESPRVMLSPQIVDSVETQGQSFASFASDDGMHQEAQLMEKPVTKNPSPSEPLAAPVAAADDSMSWGIVEGESRLMKNPNPSEPLAEPVTVDNSMSWGIVEGESRLMKNPNPSEPLAEPVTVDNSMSWGIVEGESRLMKNPNPSEPLAEPVTVDDSMSFGFADLEDEPGRLYLNPEVANAIETQGSRVAAFASDGGIQLLTQMMQKPLNKSPTPTTNGYQLVASDKMSFLLDKVATGGRFVIPPKVAEASETSGQHFAAFSSDGGIQLVTKTAPITVRPEVVYPMDASFLQYEGSRAAAGFDSDGLQYVQQNAQPANRMFLPPNVAEAVETTGQSFAAFESDGGIQKIAKTNSTLFWAQ
ncbi:MAG: hypothetical protein SGILL_001827, partial [Bacillariaceae sp.]